MLAEMPEWLLREWQVYNQFEPISAARRLEWMVSKLMALTVNMRIPEGRRKVRVDAFMPRYEPPKPTRPVESRALYRAFRDWAVLAGGGKVDSR